MSIQKQSITWNKFNWWISNDDFLTTGKQVLYTENLDINTNSNFVTLNKDSEWRFTTTDKVNWFIEARSGTSKEVFAYTEDWKIYDTSDWTVEFTFSPARKLLNAWRFNDYIYFLTDEPWLARITEANAYSNLWTWNVDESITTTWDSLPSWWDIFPVTVLLNEKFYLGKWNTVSVVDKTDVIENFDIWDWEVVWITRVWWVFKVYSENWVIAFWDWTSSSIDSFLEVQEQVRWVINDWKTDYIIAGHTDFQARVKVLNWYTIQDLLQARDSDRLWDEIFKIEYIETNQWGRLSDIIYFSQDWISGKQLLSWWTNNPVLSKWINIPFSKDSNGNNITSITSIYWVELTATDRLLIWMDSNSQDAVEYIDVSTTTPLYKDAWYLQTTAYDWWTKTIRKRIEEIRITTSDCDTNNTVELEYSIDWWAFSSLKTINSWTWITRSKIYAAKDAFYDIAFKVNFVSAWTATPKFYEIKLIYSIIEE